MGGFIADPIVERFHERVVGWLTGTEEIQGHPVDVGPMIQRLRDEGRPLLRTTSAFQFQRTQPLMQKLPRTQRFLAFTSICVSDLTQNGAVQGKMAKILTQYLGSGPIKLLA